jgi:hypothetical protein
MKDNNDVPFPIRFPTWDLPFFEDYSTSQSEMTYTMVLLRPSILMVLVRRWRLAFFDIDCAMAMLTKVGTIILFLAQCNQSLALHFTY